MLNIPATSVSPQSQKVINTDRALSLTCFCLLQKRLIKQIDKRIRRRSEQLPRHEHDRYSEPGAEKLQAYSIDLIALKSTFAGIVIES